MLQHCTLNLPHTALSTRVGKPKLLAMQILACQTNNAHFKQTKTLFLPICHAYRHCKFCQAGRLQHQQSAVQACIAKQMNLQALEICSFSLKLTLQHTNHKQTTTTTTRPHQHINTTTPNHKQLQPTTTTTTTQPTKTTTIQPHNNHKKQEIQPAKVIVLNS